MNSPKVQEEIYQASIITFNPRNESNYPHRHNVYQNKFVRQPILKQQTSIYTSPQHNNSIISLHGRKKRQRSKIQQRKSQSKIDNTIISQKNSVAQFLQPKQSYSIQQIQEKQSILKQQKVLPNSPITKLTESRLSINNHFQRNQQNFIRKDSQTARLLVIQQKNNYTPLINNKSNITAYANQKVPFYNVSVNSPNGQIFYSPPSHQIKYNLGYQQQIKHFNPPYIRFRSSSPTQNYKNSSPLHYSPNVSKIAPNVEIVEQQPPKPKILAKNRGSQSPKNSQMQLTSKNHIAVTLQQPILKDFDSNNYFSPEPTIPLQPQNIQTNQFKKFLDEQFQEISEIRQQSFQARIIKKQQAKSKKQAKNINNEIVTKQIKKVETQKVYKEDLIFTENFEKKEEYVHNMNLFQKQLAKQQNKQKIYLGSMTKPHSPFHKQIQKFNLYEYKNQQLETPKQSQQTPPCRQNKITHQSRKNKESIHLFSSHIQKSDIQQHPSQVISSQDQLTTLSKILYQQRKRQTQRNRSKSSEEKQTKESQSPKIKANIFKPVSQASSSEEIIAKQIRKELKLYYDYYSGINNNSEPSVEVSEGKSSLQKIYIEQNN